MSHVDSSEDETGLRTPRFLRRNSRYSRSTPGTPPSSAGSSAAAIGPISREGLQVWSQLPEAIRLDPSMAAFKREYERIYQNSIKKKATADEDEFAKDVMDHESHEQKVNPVYRFIKLLLLIFCWCVFTFILITKQEKEDMMHQISVPAYKVRDYLLSGIPTQSQVAVTLEGALLPPVYANLTTYDLTVWLELLHIGPNTSGAFFENVKFVKNISEPWVVPLVSEELIDIVPDQRQQKIFELQDFDIKKMSKSVLRMKLKTNLQSSLPVAMGYDLSPINVNDGIILAAMVLVGLYVLIIFEIVHRALAAMLASTMSVAILAALNERPSMAELISWIDSETLLLLFSMMVLVAIFSETGIFDYLAVFAYKITGGKVWPLIHTLCIFTAVLSSFLDNVTTVLLMTPVTIRLCEVMELNPVPVLMAMIVYSNVGGAITPVGDPPNVIIASNHRVIKAGVDFGTFTLHMGIGIFLVLIVIHFQLRFIFRDITVLRFDEPADVMELRHEIAIWQRAAASLSSYSKDEDLVRGTLTKKVQRLLNELRKKLLTGSVAIENYKANLEELTEKYPIRDTFLLVKCGVTLLFVITLFFLHSIPNLNLSLGWTALLGVLLLLVLADTEDLDGLLARVEWSTLVFFASLFILMEALSRLGLIAWIGKQTEAVILSVNEESQLAVAILLLLWVSAIASAFVDNIPLTTMMIRIATGLAHNHELQLPLQPLVWALAFGACLGGNGTLIGASANVVCAGVAEQHGYRITFMQFFKVGFPIMLSTTTIVMVYLLVAHVAFDWNGV
ncbi:P protein [Athalia rosae]|uniref:P protein n=1 Tax=Athalia rosae TaxID=37344 RepID=UPI0020332008|nr:P protein [Athalia rosae]XP_012265154.2 P protein [Athalia rosae]